MSCCIQIVREYIRVLMCLSKIILHNLQNIYLFYRQYITSAVTNTYDYNDISIYSMVLHWISLVANWDLINSLAMKLFQKIQSYLALVGVHPIRLGEKSSFNSHNSTITFSIGLFFVLTSIFIYFDANTIRKCEYFFFVWISILCIFIAFILDTRKSMDFFRFIERMEKTIEIRK